MSDRRVYAPFGEPSGYRSLPLTGRQSQALRGSPPLHKQTTGEVRAVSVA